MSTTADVIPHVTPEGLGALVDPDRPETAVEELVRLDAIVQVAQERRDQIRALFGKRPAGWTHEGAAGKIQVTSPSRVPRVEDAEAWETWAAATFPDRTRLVETLDTGLLDDLFHGRATADKLGGVDPDGARDLLIELAETIGAIRSEVVLDGKLLADLAKPARSRETDDEGLAYRETGEIIPGVRMAWASTPQVRPKPDADLIAKIADEIRGRLTPVPALETADGEEGGDDE